jgi:hypothetical protein
MEMMTSTVNPAELNEETYDEYCRLYLIEKIYGAIPVTSPVGYKHVAKLINCIHPSLFKNLQTETAKLILLNKIYSLFMQLDVELYRAFLYEQVTHISKYDPLLYRES